MSQRAVFVRLNGNLHKEIFPSVPDYEEMIQICKDFGYEPSDGKLDGNYIFLEYEWIEIGNGESGADFFFDDDTLLYIYNSYEWENQFLELGYEVEIIETGSEEILYTELEE